MKKLVVFHFLYILGKNLVFLANVIDIVNVLRQAKRKCLNIYKVNRCHKQIYLARREIDIINAWNITCYITDT